MTAAYGATTANVLRDQGQLEESCKAFQEGLQRTPKGLLQGLAISLRRRGHQQVVQPLTPVVEQALLQSNAGDNALADLLLELGNAHHALEQNDLALQRWQQGTQGAAGDKRLFMKLEPCKCSAAGNNSQRPKPFAAV